MPDDPDRKKSLREQVLEYKRGQKAAEPTRPMKGADGDFSEDDDRDVDAEDDDEADWTKDTGPTNAESRAKGFNVVKIVSTVFLCVGIALLLVSAGTFWFTRQSVAAEVAAPGLVVKNVVRAHTTRATNSSSETTSDFYHAVVEFSLADGTKKTVEMSQGNWPKAYDEGEKVTVRYDPQQPLRARLGGGTAMDFFASLLTGFLGAVFTAIAIGVKRALG